MKPVILSPGFGDERATATLYYGQDVRESLRLLPEASVHTVCTSPPYWGLRDYGTGDAQIGLEETPDEFVSALVEVFREIKRVLRPDGTLWVNLGDSYAGGGGGNYGSGISVSSHNTHPTSGKDKPSVPSGLKAKDLVGIPWRVAFALQADGWYLRQDIIWAKGSCMPESVTDRCTKAHEYVFLFAHPDSGGRYFYDAEAVKEKPAGYFREGGTAPTRDGLTTHGRGSNTLHQMSPTGRNKRSVWTVTTKPYSGAHFATWPPDLVEPMIRAGTSERGCCPTCGEPWRRVVNNRSVEALDVVVGGCPDRKDGGDRVRDLGGMGGTRLAIKRVGTDQWEPACRCGNQKVIPCTVLDPFSGSATTGMVALREGRNYIGIDLNPEYLPLAEARLREDPAPRKIEEDPERELDLFDLFGEEGSE